MQSKTAMSVVARRVRATPGTIFLVMGMACSDGVTDRGTPIDAEMELDGFGDQQILGAVEEGETDLSHRNEALPVSKLTEARREQLEARALEHFRVRRHGDPARRVAPDQPTVASEPSPSNSDRAAALEPGSPLGTQEVPDAAEQAALDLWNEILDGVYENPEGGFAIGDMYLGDAEDLLKYFDDVYASRMDKGLITPSTAWPRTGGGTTAPLVEVCWFLNGSANNNDMNRVIQLVQNSWGSIGDITFSFTDGSGGFNNCLNAPGAGQWEISIFQDATIGNGCSRIGSGSLNLPGVNCNANANHAQASMVLPAPGSIFADYTIVHEFGHAIGILHEQIRLEYNWWDPGDPTPPPTRNCSSADADITIPPTPPNILPDRMVPGPNDQTVGSFDDNSIMYYCQQEVTLGPNWGTDPRASEISLGDIVATRTLYPTNIRTREVIFRHSSWYNTQVDLVIQLAGAPPFTDWTVNSTPGAQNFATGLVGQVGSGYTVQIFAPNNARLRCTGRGGAPGVFNYPPVVPPVGFAGNEIRAQCYDPASATQVVSAL